MANEITIPILPCQSINDTLIFYQALGFEVTYQQAKPNTYAVVRRGGIELHFFAMKELDPADSYSTCFVLVQAVDDLYKEFVAALRQHYGRLPSAGIPRMTVLRNKSFGTRGFNIIDPGGNWIRIAQKMEVAEAEPKTQKGTSTKLSRAVQAADLLTDSKGDYAAAAKILDEALAASESEASALRVQALVARAGLAITLNDFQQARTLLAAMRQIKLEDDEQSALSSEFERAADLEHMLQETERGG